MIQRSFKMANALTLVVTCNHGSLTLLMVDGRGNPVKNVFLDAIELDNIGEAVRQTLVKYWKLDLEYKSKE